MGRIRNEAPSLATTIARKMDAAADAVATWWTGKPKYIRTAEGQLGQQETPDETNNPQILEYLASTDLNSAAKSTEDTPWCACFANWVSQESGIPGVKSGAAWSQSWKSWGQALKAPALHSLAVISYGGGKGHVGYVMGQTPDGKIVLLGGNQGGRAFGGGGVTYSPVDAKLIAYRWPPNMPLPPKEAYNLPILNVQGSSLNVGNTR